MNDLPLYTVNDNYLQLIARKVVGGERLSFEEGLALYRCTDLLFLSVLATHRRKQLNGTNVFYNRNVHIEPTNICVNDCVFCSYRRDEGAEGSWDYSLDTVRELCRSYDKQSITEIHVVGGVHPRHDIFFYAELLAAIKEILPHVAIKAFTAIEIDAMARKANMSWDEGLRLLREKGLDALPGGGAEIFDPVIRRQICPSKAGAETWLGVHEAAHNIGIRTNATMLFGHIEQIEHRMAHLMQLRALQDKTGGFDAFIPLKYKAMNNALEAVGEVNAIEVLRNFAVCRLLLDNIPHLKAYWPMLGKELMQLALLFGADDIDGTIDDSTKIYSMAGAADQHPVLTVPELTYYILSAGFQPVERNTFYEEIVHGNTTNK